MGAVALLLAGSCVHGHDECDYGDDHCDGSNLVTCEPPCAEVGCGRSWRTQPCGGACVSPLPHQPLCVLSTQPDPRCEGVVGYCDGDSPVACNSGFATSRIDCAEQQLHCAPLPHGGAQCALSGAPDPRCIPDVVDQIQVCDGSMLLTCREGYLFRVEACRRVCVAPNPGYAFCALSSEPDPACERRLQDMNYSFFCRENALAYCTDNNYVGEHQHCMDDTCEEQNALASCVSRAGDADAGSPDAGKQ